jgi:hypothetical protein
MYTLGRQNLPQLTERARPWWFFTILSVIALACASCNNAVQQTSQPRGRTVQSPHVTIAAGMPLTDSAPPQLDVTPMVLVPQLHNSLTIATPTSISTPTPKIIPTSYEAEAPQNTLTGSAGPISCSSCSGGYRVCCISVEQNKPNGTVQFNNVNKSIVGSYTMTMHYTSQNTFLMMTFFTTIGQWRYLL